MNQATERDLFKKVMEIHHLVFEELNGSLIVRKSKEKNKTLQTYLYLSIAGVVIGILFLLSSSKAIGKILTGLSGAFLVLVINLREREKDTEKKVITVGHHNIEIEEGFKTRKVNLEEIAEFRTKVEQHHNLFVGSILIITENKMCYEFMEIFGSDEHLIQEDLIIISNYIVDHYLPSIN